MLPSGLFIAFVDYIFYVLVSILKLERTVWRRIQKMIQAFRQGSWLVPVDADRREVMWSTFRERSGKYSAQMDAFLRSSSELASSLEALGDSLQTIPSSLLTALPSVLLRTASQMGTVLEGMVLNALRNRLQRVSAHLLRLVVEDMARAGVDPQDVEDDDRVDEESPCTCSNGADAGGEVAALPSHGRNLRCVCTSLVHLVCSAALLAIERRGQRPYSAEGSA